MRFGICGGRIFRSKTAHRLGDEHKEQSEGVCCNRLRYAEAAYNLGTQHLRGNTGMYIEYFVFGTAWRYFAMLGFQWGRGREIVDLWITVEFVL